MKAKKIVALTLVSILFLSACGRHDESNNGSSEKSDRRTESGRSIDLDNSEQEKIGINMELVDKDIDTIEGRYKTPKGYKRLRAGKNTFTEFIRSEKLKPY